MLRHIAFVGSILTLLTACGGGGGGGGSSSAPPPATLSSSSSSSVASSSSSSSTSSSSSSISSSSSSSVNPCNNTSGTIFSECLNAAYGFIVGAQYLPSYIEYTTSSSGEQVQWSIIDTDSTHNKVVDVKLSDNNRRGQFFIGYPDSKPSTQDLSQFQTGSLEFDLRVLNFGDAYNAESGGIKFVVRMDCVWPCAAHETPIIIPTLDTWTHISLPMSDLINSGLDMSKISASFVLVPYGNQAGLHFQLDNVQLAKGGPVEVGPKVIFKEDFNTKAIPNWQFSKPVGNASADASTSFGFGAYLLMNWMNSNDVLRFTTALDNTIDITRKKASFQLSCMKNSSMNFSFQMISTDSNGVVGATQVNYAMGLNTETWYQVYADFGNVFDADFDAKHIRTIGLQFNNLGGGFGSTGCQVDTIRITE